MASDFWCREEAAAIRRHVPCKARPASSSSSSSSAYPWKYDVFLSFRGEDTRNTFVGHLYRSLRLKGLHTFIDDKQLERGKEISPELLEAIEQSRLAVIVFSENYSSSSWCLDELVKILECYQLKGQKVLPVFYKVDPSHVRKQKGSFARAFKKHKRDYAAQEMEKVEKWRTALEKAGSISGWDTEKTANGHEATCIQEITDDIYKKLGSPISSIIARERGFVGIDSRAEKVCSMLDVGGSNEVRIVGIWGMGGIGKTTLARVVYDRIVNQFEDSSFLAVGEFLRERGLEALRKELNSLVSKLCHERVLVVLDNVDAIAGQFDAFPISYSWAGPGCRIIITSRDAHLLDLLGVGVDTRYDVEALDTNEALQLFSLKAFKESNPPQDYVDLSYQILHYADGLPLALVVLGASLFRRDLTEWEDTLGKLKKIGNKDILAVLKISFDGLDDLEKQIFLDIACFFVGELKDFVIRILEACGFHPIIGIKALIERSLITVSSYCLQMHALIQEMGHHIVRTEDREPGRRSRIWNPEDAYQALVENTVMDAVEGISLCFYEPKDVNCNSKVFKKMNRLRVLIISNARISPGSEIEYLLNKLVFINWNEYPSKSLPTSFVPDNLVKLRLTYSRITELWKGRQTLGKLKTLDLTGSQKLERTPDFTGLPNLEELFLGECTKLGEVHPSIAFHKKLRRVNMHGCSNLKSLADNIHLESLESLNLSGCLQFEKFPEIVGKMEKLEELDLDWSGIKELPLSIKHLSGLQTIVLQGCKKITRLPETLGEIQTLRELDARDSAIKQIPSSVTLEELYLMNCKGMMTWESGSSTILPGCLPRECDKYDMGLALHCLTNLCGLTNLDLSGAHILDGVLPDDLGCLQNLQRLHLSETNIEALPKLPSRLEDLYADNCLSLTRVVPGIFSRCSERLRCISLVNCFGLVENQEDSFLDAVMQWFSKTISLEKERGSVTLPGSEIPKWFTCQGTTLLPTVSPHVSVSYPSRWLDYDGEIAYCFVYEVAVGLPYNVGDGPRPFPELCGPHLYMYYERTYQPRPFFTHYLYTRSYQPGTTRKTMVEATKIGYRLLYSTGHEMLNFKSHDDDEDDEHDEEE